MRVDKIPTMSLFPKSEIEQTIPRRFEKQVAAQAQHQAIVDGGDSLTYESLNIRANQLAWALLKKNLHQGPVVCLCEQGIPFIVATLGILKSGTYYAPLDPQDSDESLIQLFNRIEPVCIVADRAGIGRLASLPNNGIPIITQESMGSNLPTHNPDPDLSPDSLAYIYFTTGSTGEPKGVIDNHRNVLHNVMRYTNSLSILAGDRLTLLHAPNLSACVSSQFGALLNGASVFPKRFQASTIETLPSWLIEHRISIYHSVPAVFRFALNPSTLDSSLRIMRLEGDQAAINDLAIFQAFSPPGCVLVNGLGTSETGICRQYFFEKTSTLPKGNVPVGYPVEDMEIMILDAEGLEFPKNEIGEIAVRSSFLSSGYWNDSQRTAESFSASSENENLRTWKTGDLGMIKEDGCLDYLGRLNADAEISRQADPLTFQPNSLTQQTGSSSTLTSQTLASIWADIFNRETISGHDNFFQIGGNSLHAFRLVAEIQTLFSVPFSVKEVFEHPNLNDQLQLLEAKLSDCSPEDQGEPSS
mgnify:CR=1 FL=1